jgi:ABC-type dipeptide/oligopeptide/nickel transport system permease component
LARATLAGKGLVDTLAAAAPLGTVHPPFVLTSVVLLEIGLHLPGLGSTAVSALASGDVNAWMASSLSLALVTLLLRNLADLILPRNLAVSRT